MPIYILKFCIGEQSFKYCSSTRDHLRQPIMQVIRRHHRSNDCICFLAQMVIQGGVKLVQARIVPEKRSNGCPRCPRHVHCGWRIVPTGYQTKQCIFDRRALTVASRKSSIYYQNQCSLQMPRINQYWRSGINWRSFGSKSSLSDLLGYSTAETTRTDITPD